MKLAKLFAVTVAPFALLAANPALADNHAAATAATAARGPAMWKVADEDTTIYLFGTVHVLPKEVEWYDATIEKALTGADVIVTEIPMDPASDAATQQLAMTKGMLPSGTTLRSLLTPEQTATYESALAKVGAPPETFDAFKPWMTSLTLTVIPLMQQGYDPTAGVEKVLLSKVNGKPQGALETVEFQLGIYDNMPQQAQISQLMETIESMDEVKPFIDSLVAAWGAGDPEKLASIMNEGMKDPAVAEALLYSRNANWAEWIDTRMDTPGTVFIAVGAGHLAGAKSVQDYLAEKGITVTRVK
jgi:uncharacterized protein YbaP (TraB family)